MYILKLSCPDQPGIVFNVSRVLFDAGFDILHSAQFGDASTKLFFMRVAFQPCHVAKDDELLQTIQQQFSVIADNFHMQWQICDASRPTRLLVMVSQWGHCLNDLLFRWKTKQINCDIPAIVSNHTDFALLAASYGIPFFHVPVKPDNKADAERAMLQIADQSQVDCIILARYMQVLSPAVCDAWAGRMINIHHSFLPSFKGARPYQQAYDRGVKLIGATAHYVTSDLDEGPIIEQDVARVDHNLDVEALAAIGRDVEAQVLARAVRWQCEHRIVLNGHKTVIFK